MSAEERSSRAPRPGPHLLPGQLGRYARRELPPAELLAVDDHLAGCARCREALGEIWDAAPARAAWLDLAAPAVRHPADPGSPARPEKAVGDRSGRARRALQLAASLLVLAGGAWLSHEATVVRRQAPQTAALEARLRAAESEVARLRAANRELERQAERLAATPAPPVRPPAVQAHLMDQGRPVELLADGTLTGLPGLAPVWRTAIAEALLAGRLAVPPALGELRTAGSPLRGADAVAPPFAILGPAGTVVRDARPRFRWTPLAGATGYRVVLFDRAYHPVLAGDEIQGTEWTPPRSLPQGRVLVWQVVARRGGEEIAAPAPPAPEACLRVLTRAERRALEETERQVAGAHLSHAVLLARTGLLDEARTEIAALAQENPGSLAAGRLLASLAGDRR